MLASDANAQTVLLQFMTTGIPRVKVPTSVHTDHLIVAREGAKADLEAAKLEHGEVYRFLESACQKVSCPTQLIRLALADTLLAYHIRQYGLDFWRPGVSISPRESGDTIHRTS